MSTCFKQVSFNSKCLRAYLSKRSSFEIDIIVYNSWRCQALPFFLNNKTAACEAAVKSYWRLDGSRGAYMQYCWYTVGLLIDRYVSSFVWLSCYGLSHPGRGGGLPNKKDGVARLKFWKLRNPQSYHWRFCFVGVVWNVFFFTLKRYQF